EIANSYNEAIPDLARNVPCQEPEIRILALRSGPPADQFRGLVRKALTNTQLVYADSPDDIIMYREQPAIPIDKLELLGPIGQGAYIQMNQADNFSAHSREDITNWQGAKQE